MDRILLSSRKMEWRTPQDFFIQLDSKYHFTLDPASTDENSKCINHFTEDDDGLRQSWEGHTVFCNPPYGRGIIKWVKKGYEESQKPNTTVVMLIPARTDTKYFHDYIFGKATHIEFIRGRLKFEDENGVAGDSAPFPCAVIEFKSEV